MTDTITTAEEQSQVCQKIKKENDSTYTKRNLIFHLNFGIHKLKAIYQFYTTNLILKYLSGEQSFVISIIIKLYVPECSW